MRTGFGAISTCGARLRPAFAVTPTTFVRTTVWQHAMSIWPQSPAIFSQQSISRCVSDSSGMKHAIWGASAQNAPTVKTNARNDQDIFGSIHRPLAHLLEQFGL